MFSEAVEFALASRWLLPGDILVMNNSKIHTGGEKTVLEDWLGIVSAFVCYSCLLGLRGGLLPMQSGKILLGT